MLILTTTQRALLNPVVYVLACASNHYYVGFTQHLDRRLDQHFSGEGADFTKRFPPLHVYEIKPGKDEKDEYLTWRNYVTRFGLPRVGGYNYYLCQKFGFPWPGPVYRRTRRKIF